MSRSNTLGISWPPRGWEQLSFVKKLSTQAIVKDPMLATITGLTYKIDPIPVYLKNNARSYIYRLNIEGWEYSIQNESCEYSILSFYFQERLNKALPKNHSISDIKINSRPLVSSRYSASRAYMAAIFIMKQIESGKVPDCDRILRLYKIHPTQRSLYDLDCKQTCENAQDCVTMSYCFD